MDWVFNSWLWVFRTKDNALSEIRRQKSVFEDSVMSADAAGTSYSRALIPSVLERFKKLESDVGHAKTLFQIDELIEEAYPLARFAAYVCPPKEIELQGQTLLNCMEEWRVPKSTIEALRKDILPRLKDTNELAARGALITLQEEYDSWSDYIDGYNKDMRNVTYILASMTVVSLGGAIFSISHGYVLLGLLLAGACGAFVSVVAKVPALNTVYGDSAPYMRGIFTRVCMGIAASVIGSGFLFSGLVTVTLPSNITLQGMIEACDRDTSWQTTEAKAGPVIEPSKLSQVAPGEKGGCKTENVLILAGLVMLFGFSERALTSFEEKIFPSKPAGKP